MKFQSPSLPELHAFLAVFELGSFRSAASVLCVTQAAVSRAVQRLEQRLGCSLFDRTASGVSPTARGREFQSLVQEPVAALENSMASFGNKAKNQKMRISVITTLSTHWLVPRLAKFHTAFPSVKIELRTYQPSDDFGRDDVDLWIEVNRPNTSWPRGFCTQYLLGKEITPICTPEIAGRLRTPQDLLHEELLYHTSFPGNWALWFAKASLSHQQPPLGQGFENGNNLIVASCAGMGVSVIHPCLVENELRSGQLVRPFKTMVSTGRGWYACYKNSLAQSHSVLAFVPWLLEQARETEASLQSATALAL